MLREAVWRESLHSALAWSECERVGGTCGTSGLLGTENEKGGYRVSYSTKEKREKRGSIQ
jgi:hypothetical protein